MNIFLNFPGQQETSNNPSDKRVFHNNAMFTEPERKFVIEAKYFCIVFLFLFSSLFFCLIFFLALNVYPDEVQNEPWWISIAFYDIKNRIKLSEDFHFEFNDIDSVNTYMSRFYTPNPDKETFAKRAIFSFSNLNEFIYLVVKVKRVLKGYRRERES